MEDKLNRAREAVLKAQDSCDNAGWKSHSDDIINDIANSLADNFEEYLKIWNYLQCTF